MDLVTVEEVSKILKTHPNTVYKMCRSGQLPAMKIGKDWRIDRERISEFINSGATPAKTHCSSDNALEISLSNSRSHSIAFMAGKDDVWSFDADFFKNNAGKDRLLFKACWWQTPEQFRNRLTKIGFPVASLESSGELLIENISMVFQESGPVAAADVWRSAAHTAKKRGFKGVIGSGSPAFNECCSVEDLLIFENALDGFLDGLPIEGVCAYNLDDKALKNWSTIVRLISLHNHVQFYSENKEVTAVVTR